VHVSVRLSETATVTARLQRRGAKRVLAFAHVQAPAGKRRLTLRLRSRLPRGTYKVTLQARDAAGNRSAATKTMKAGR
jgi:hypothetical protein